MLRGYLELLRPANVVTAIADVLAGYAVAGRANHRALPWLLVATVCLYAGGVVLNDFFDRGLDAVERPERPIPSGRVPAHRAAALGAALMASGVAAAGRATWAAAVIAAVIASLVLLYDVRGKRHAIAGPVNMGLCRGFNVVLGIAAVPAALAAGWPIAVLSVIYIAAVTTVSRGEVHGGKTGAATFALVSLGVVLIALTTLAMSADTSARIAALGLTAALGFRVLPPFWQVSKDPRPEVVRRAVKTGVLSLALVDATIGTAYAGPVYGAAVLATALAAGWLARVFSVT